jgi:hypothetical protein
VGAIVGTGEGKCDGENVGVIVGDNVTMVSVGAMEARGFDVGLKLGTWEGDTVGEKVGEWVFRTHSLEKEDSDAAEEQLPAHICTWGTCFSLHSFVSPQVVLDTSHSHPRLLPRGSASNCFAHWSWHSAAVRAGHGSPVHCEKHERLISILQTPSDGATDGTVVGVTVGVCVGAFDGEIDGKSVGSLVVGEAVSLLGVCSI